MSYCVASEHETQSRALLIATELKDIWPYAIETKTPKA